VKDIIQKNGLVPGGDREKLSGREIVVYSVSGLIITALLMLSNIPMASLFVLAAIAYLAWRLVSSPKPSKARRIFEFYLMADEIISNPKRSWYGFELELAIRKGEEILRELSQPPSLVIIGLARLNEIAGRHDAASELIALLASGRFDEAKVFDATEELRQYVSFLRRIERSPEESPTLSRAVRRLERLRMKISSSTGSVVTTESGSPTERNSLCSPAAGLPGQSLFDSTDAVSDMADIDRPRRSITDVLKSVYDLPGDKDAN
jgi:hypothetical protein